MSPRVKYRGGNKLTMNNADEARQILPEEDVDENT